MQVVQKEKQGLKHSFEVKIPRSVINQNIETKLQEISEKVTIPGFRPGKAPATLLKQKYGGSVMGEVVDFTVRDSYTKALEEKGLRAAAAPKVEIKEFGDDKDLVYTFDVEVMPEIKVKGLDKVKFEKIKCDVTDKDIDEALKTLSERHKASRELTEKRAAKTGDHVTIDFLGKVDGVAFEGGEAKGYKLHLGSGNFLPDFESGVVGISVGESKDIPVGFPAEYHAPNLAGKTATFTITVHKIEEEMEAKIDDELAKRLGFPSLDDLKEAAKTQIGREYDAVAREKNKKALFDVLHEEFDFELPQGLLEDEFKSIWKQFEEAKKNNQVAAEDKEKSDADMEKELRDIAERRVKLGLLLSEIGSHNKIEVSDDELRRAIIAEAQRYPGQEQKVVEFYSTQPQALMSIRGPLLEEKVIDFIFEVANVTVKSITKEDLFTADDSGKSSGKKSAKSSKKAESSGDAEEAKPKAKKAKKE
ncbi:MAG: trigger factor [Alphaproteobacteria bacterium]|nr:MAG: trigger factor [Alphaproteobacteria bacterium]